MSREASATSTAASKAVITERSVQRIRPRPCDCTDCNYVTLVTNVGPGGKQIVTAYCDKTGDRKVKPDPRCRHWRPQKPQFDVRKKMTSYASGYHG